ncbi:hypothetical protein TWF730_000721 [Orbilia blumenaviensis]|uniref:Uncharacterized protein n=1 Tax=Orbilia blumenaviensis TaxID=1796055 RepID=A0AAV9VQK4_9PEZI
MNGSTLGSSSSSSKQFPRRTRQRARSLRKSLLTFASSSPAISIHGPKNSGGSADGANATGRATGLASGDGGASSSLNNSEDDDHLSPPPLMMRDASSAASRSSSRISRSFRRTSSSRHVDYADTVWWGWAVLITTWVVFVVGMGSVLGIWDWAWFGPAGAPVLPEDEDHDPDDDLPIPGYYPALVILTWVVAWVWVIIAWVGMKYFRHARVAPAN